MSKKHETKSTAGLETEYAEKIQSIRSSNGFAGGTIVSKMVNGSGPYAYLVAPPSSGRTWHYLGKAKGRGIGTDEPEEETNGEPHEDDEYDPHDDALFVARAKWAEDDAFTPEMQTVLSNTNWGTTDPRDVTPDDVELALELAEEYLRENNPGMTDEDVRKWRAENASGYLKEIVDE